MTGENCRQFRLLTWSSRIVYFVYPVRRERGKGGGCPATSFTLLEYTL